MKSLSLEEFERILDVDRRSWKGPERTGLLIDEMERFIRPLSERLASRDALRVLFARRGGEGIGYILTGVLGHTYRGFQCSFDRRHAELSPGNLLQIVQIEELCEEGHAVHDLGIDMDCKRHWAEEAVDTVTLAVSARRPRGPPSWRRGRS